MLAASPAAAAVIFEDDFNDYAQSIPWDGGPKWQIEEGSVDLVRSGNFSIDCVGNTGGCVDLVGTRPGGENTGEILTSAAIALAAGSYSFSFDYSGNQRGALPSLFQASVIRDGSLLPALTTIEGPLTADAPWTTFTANFYVPVAGNYIINFDQQFGPVNQGNLIDNVVLATTAIPEPQAWAMMISGLGLVGAAMRRRRRPFRMAQQV